MCGGATGALAAAVTLAALATSVHAQDSTARPQPLGTTTVAPLFTAKDAVLAGAFAVSTVAMFPLDERLAKHLRNPGAQANDFFRRSSTGVEWVASPGAYVIGGALYAVGRLGHYDRLADLGWHGTEAVVFADVVTIALKGITGRARPFASADTNPHDFKLLGGVTTDWRQSFPSGHATSAFAAAAAVTAETGRWWPRSTPIIGTLMYGGATMVALSRMYHNAHWASDVALGAAIGTFSGMKIVQYSHAHRTGIDRVMIPTVAVDGRGNAIVGWTF